MRDNWIVCMYAMVVFLMAPLAAHSQTARGAASLLAGSPSAQANDAPQSAPDNFDSGPWLVDFHQLINELDTHYADLDWAIQDRHMNLPKLRRDTEEKLQQATDTQLARNAFEQFLDAFGDGHLSIDWPSSKTSTRSNASASVEPLCSRLGYKSPNKKGLDFLLLPGFVTVPSENSDQFPGGILLFHSGRLGVIRIANFNEHGFPTECENTIREMHLTDASACDLDCARTIALTTTNNLTKAIVKKAEQLRSLGATSLLVDLTHNDGGDDWNEAVARSLANIPLIDEQRGFINYSSWTAKLQNDLNIVERDLNGNKEPRAVLKQAAAQLRQDVLNSKNTCDRREAFETGSVSCSLVSKGLFWSGVLPYAKPGSFLGLESRTTLFNPLQYEYVEGKGALPLWVAIDAHSWSSAERFAALLQDNQAATIIGELSGGTGCGFVNGGMPTTLSRSHAHVSIPNCVGFRKDGSNANDGVTPDVLVPWAQRDTPFTRVYKFRNALESGLQATQR